jgi:hypothetical protein
LTAVIAPKRLVTFRARRISGLETVAAAVTGMPAEKRVAKPRAGCSG